MNWLKYAFLSAFILASCQTDKYQIAQHSKSEEGIEVQQFIPFFKLPDSTNHLLSIEQAMGKATLLDFWASWCRPCRESANPAYQKLYQKYHSKGLQIIGVSSDRHQYFWKKALRQDSLPWFQVIDSTHRVLKLYQVKSIPAMFLIDQNGKIAGKNLWGEDLERKIDSLLKN